MQYQVVNLVSPIVPIYRDMYKEAIRKLIEEEKIVAIDHAEGAKSEKSREEEEELTESIKFIMNNQTRHIEELGQYTNTNRSCSNCGGGGSSSSSSSSTTTSGSNSTSSNNSSYSSSGPITKSYLQRTSTEQRWALCNNLPEQLRCVFDYILIIFRHKHTHFTNFLSHTTSLMSFIRPKFTFLLIFLSQIIYPTEA